eukprot:3208489-Prymnesium_polylepis.2
MWPGHGCNKRQTVCPARSLRSLSPRRSRRCAGAAPAAAAVCVWCVSVRLPHLTYTSVLSRVIGRRIACDNSEPLPATSCGLVGALRRL